MTPITGFDIAVLNPLAGLLGAPTALAITGNGDATDTPARDACQI